MYKHTITLKFVKMAVKLPPKNKMVIFQDIAGQLFAGQYLGNGKCYDPKTKRHTTEPAYDVIMHGIFSEIAMYGPISKSELIAWANYE